MEHHKELMDTMRLLNICKVLEGYTVGLLSCIDEKQKRERKKQHDEWIEIIDGLVAKSGNDERVKESFKPMIDLIEMVYGDNSKKLIN